MPAYTKAIQAYKNKRFQLAKYYAGESLYHELELLSADEQYYMFWIISESDIALKAGK